MRKLILEEWISLDGYAEDKNGKLDFFPSTEANQFSDRDQLQFLDRIDTMLLGRKTYELFAGFWPEATIDTEIIADKLNSLDKYVFSNTLKKAPWGKFPEAKIVTGDAVSAVKKLKQQNGKDLVLWGSISLAQDLIKARLIDEFHLQVCPVATGGGHLLFPDLAQYENFELTDIRKYDTGVVFLNYKPKS